MTILTEAIAAAKAANKDIVEIWAHETKEMPELQVELKPYICRATSDKNMFIYDIEGIEIRIIPSLLVLDRYDIFMLTKHEEDELYKIFAQWDAYPQKHCIRNFSNDSNGLFFDINSNGDCSGSVTAIKIGQSKHTMVFLNNCKYYSMEDLRQLLDRPEFLGWFKKIS